MFYQCILLNLTLQIIKCTRFPLKGSIQVSSIAMATMSSYQVHILPHLKPNYNYCLHLSHNIELLMTGHRNKVHRIMFVTIMKSTQRTNFQSIVYFAYLFMKLTLIYVKVVKYFPLWHNFILNVPASSAQKLLQGKVPARINISRNGKYPQIHFLQ